MTTLPHLVFIAIIYDFNTILILVIHFCSMNFHKMLYGKLGDKEGYTAIPYREITGFLQGFPCVVIPPLHALAVYSRVANVVADHDDLLTQLRPI